MNKILKYFMMVVVAIAGLSFASCSDDDDNYNVGEFSDGAYLYSSFTSKTFKPEDTQTFSITLGRTNVSEDATYELKCDNENFTAPTQVTFKAGQKDVEVPVTCDLELGQSEDVMFTIPTDKSSVYGDDTLSLTIMRDYTWEEVGTAEFTDADFTGYSAEVKVMKAKEYSKTKEDGSVVSYYKFAAPMTEACKQNGEEELPGEADFKFYMDDKGNVEEIADGFYDMETGTSVLGYQFYYNRARYADYCFFTNENGEFTFSSLIYDGTNLAGGITWTFSWKDGYPVKNTEEGEGSQEGGDNQGGEEAGE